MALSIVQVINHSNQLGLSTTATFSSNVTAGNSIVVCARAGTNNTPVSTVTDNKSNSYSLVKSNHGAVSGDPSVEIWKADNVAAGSTTITVTWTGTGNPGIGFGAGEIGGTSGGTLSLDGSNTGAGFGTNPSAGSITPANNNDIIIASLGYAAGTTGTTAGTGFTAGTLAAGDAWEYQVQTTATTVTGNFVNANSAQWRAIIVGLSLGGSPPPPAAGKIQVIFMGW